MKSLFNSMLASAKLVGSFTLLGFALVGCSQDDTMVNAGESMDQSYESVKEGAQKMGSKMGSKMEEAAENIHDSAVEMSNDAMDSMENAAEETKYKFKKMQDAAGEDLEK